MASTRPRTSTFATSRPRPATTAVASATAASGAGTTRAAAGSFGHRTSTAMVPMPTAAAVSEAVSPMTSTRRPGSPAILSTPERGCSAPAMV
ncbi:hypothetical protein SALBM135S_03208 [Streptomyces alboniger]